MIKKKKYTAIGDDSKKSNAYHENTRCNINLVRYIRADMVDIIDNFIFSHRH